MGRVIIRQGKRFVSFLDMSLPFEYIETLRTIEIRVFDMYGKLYVRHTYNKNVLVNKHWDNLPHIILTLDALCLDMLIRLAPENLKNLYTQYNNVCTPY